MKKYAFEHNELHATRTKEVLVVSNFVSFCLVPNYAWHYFTNFKQTRENSSQLHDNHSKDLYTFFNYVPMQLEKKFKKNCNLKL